MTTTTNLFSTDPAVLTKVTRVNGLPVLATRTDGSRTFVLCDRGGGMPIKELPEGFHRYVTWSIWRTEDGSIAAEAGDYITDVVEAVINLHFRAGQIHKVSEMLRRFA